MIGPNMQDFEFTEEEIQEFKAEALELLDEAEDSFLKLDKDKNLSAHYDVIFRAFHSVKGGAGMLNMEALRDHMHLVENAFQKHKQESELATTVCSGFLNAIDYSRDILDGKSGKFDPIMLTGEGAESVAGASDSEGRTSADSSTSDNPSSAKNASDAEIASPNFRSAKRQEREEKRKREDSPGFVVLVDDEEEILSIIEFVLESEGYETKTFSDPLEAINAIPDLDPDAVFTDISMPGMTGDELMKEIHKWNADIPVIFVSGYITKEVLMEAISKGVYGAIDKPINETQLISTCIHACRRYRALKFIRKAISLLLYQYSNLDEYLQKSGLEDIRVTIQAEVKELIQRSKEFRSSNTK